MRTRSHRLLAYLLTSSFLVAAHAHAQPTLENDPEEPTQPPRASLPEPTGTGGLAPAQVARDSERMRVAMPDIDIELLQGSTRARALDARRRRLMWYGLFQGGFVLAFLPYAVHTLRSSHDPVIRTVTGSWIALGSSIVTATSAFGAHATLLESRLYRCNREPTPRRLGRTAMVLAFIPGLSLVSPYYAHRQHQLNESTRECELRETLRRRRIHIIPEDDLDSETIGPPEE